jgi:fatty-acyl-CoA synthase
VDAWLNKTIPQVLDERAAVRGDHEALVIGGQRITYRQLQQESRRIARRLLASGFTPQSRVAVLMEASAELLLLYYAICRIGAAIIPVNFNFKESELEYLLRQSDCTHLVFVDTILGRDYWSYLQNLTGGFPASEPGVVNADRFPRLRGLICLNRATGKGASRTPAVLDYDELIAGDNPERAEELARCQAAVSAGDTCYLLLTSGSTGFPKLAQVTHRGIVGVAHYYCEYLRMTEDSRLMAHFTLYHIGGLGFGVASTLYAGACFYTSRVFEPGEVLETIERERITVMGFFDTHVTKIMGHPRFAKTDRSSIKSALFGGPPATYDRLRRDWGIPLVTPNYASTETGASIALVPPQVSDEAVRKQSNGRPIPGVAIKIVDPESGKESQAGQSGEIRVKGWSVCNGYYNMPEQNAEAFDAEGYFCTGDVGHLDQNGYVYYTGRYKMMVKTGGENVSEIEVENYLGDLVPGLRAVRVVGIPDPVWGEAVTAFIELAPEATRLSLEDLRARCKQHVAAFKVPRHVIYLQADEWPVTTAGKVSKPDLRHLAVQRLGGQGAGPVSI